MCEECFLHMDDSLFGVRLFVCFRYIYSGGDNELCHKKYRFFGFYPRRCFGKNNNRASIFVWWVSLLFYDKYLHVVILIDVCLNVCESSLQFAASGIYSAQWRGGAGFNSL